MQRTTDTPFITINLFEGKSVNVTKRQIFYVATGFGSLLLAKSYGLSVIEYAKSLLGYGVSQGYNVSPVHLLLQEVLDITTVTIKIVGLAAALPIILKATGFLAELLKLAIAWTAESLISATEALSILTDRTANWLLSGTLTEACSMLKQYGIRAVLTYLLMLTILVPARMYDIL